ncbi:UrcA family protein [Sphingomonas kaistensis]|uniref:UrcA family protein n=1 Tax=Sphingomonas kaistensis TaxID=298708 RepID=A0ABZ2FY13_9SPHN
MESRKFACLTAAIAFGLSLVGIAGAAAASGPLQDVVVKGERIDPDLQRRVSYADLNLAFRPGQKILASRIRSTANGLCWDLNGPYSTDRCTIDAIDSTKGQVAAAVERAKRQMAGLPVGPAVAISMVIGAR